MKKVLSTFALLLATLVVFGQSSIKDSRDGTKYAVVNIGNQTWMAENLNYTMQGSYCFDNDKSNCERYGRLYTWHAAMKACPDGWKLPSREEFETMINFYGGKDKAGAELVESGKSGFNARFAGDYTGDDDFFFGEGQNTSFWSTTVANKEDAFTMAINHDGFSISIYQNLFQNGYSVRCLKK